MVNFSTHLRDYMVHFPEKIPYLRPFTILLGLAVFVWMALEGNLTYSLIMALWSVLVGWGHLLQRFLGGRTMRLWRFLLTMVATGLAGGLIANLAVLTFMAIKTGLHGHGPEFSDYEVIWVIGQMPLWLVVGTLLGLGLGLVFGSRASPASK